MTHPAHRGGWSSRVPVASWSLAVVLTVGGVVAHVLHATRVPGSGFEAFPAVLLNAIVYSTVGAVVAARRRANPIGWLLLGTVAALFQPLRRRVQSVVDRRFNRARYDAARTVDAFSRRLRGEVDLEAVRSDLVDVVGRTLQPARASVWLRPTSRA